MPVVHERPSPRERRREAKLRRILDTAMEIATTEGFEALSMNRLADACDYTPGALYRYFESKDMLLSALLERVLEQVGEAVAERVAAVPRDEPLTRILAILRAYFRFSCERPHEFRLIAAALGSPRMLLATPQSAEPIVRGMIDTMSPLGEALSNAAEAGDLTEGDALERTLVLFASVQGVLQLHRQARIAPALIDVERLSAAAARSLLMGWGADEAAVEAAHDAALDAVGRPGGPS